MGDILLKGKATCSAAPTSGAVSAWPPLGAFLSSFSWKTLAWGCSSSHCTSSAADTWAPCPPLAGQSPVGHSHGRLDPCHLQKSQPLLIYHLQTKLVFGWSHVFSPEVYSVKISKYFSLDHAGLLLIKWAHQRAHNCM